MHPLDLHGDDILVGVIAAVAVLGRRDFPVLPGAGVNRVVVLIVSAFEARGHHRFEGWCSNSHKHLVEIGISSHQNEGLVRNSIGRVFGSGADTPRDTSVCVEPDRAVVDSTGSAPARSVIFGLDGRLRGGPRHCGAGG